MSSSYSVCASCGKVNKVDLNKTGEKQPTCGSCGRELPFHNGYSELNPSQVQTLIAKSSLPVVIDFWAPWCGPCRMFAPAFQAGAKDFAGKITFVKINTEDHPDAGPMFGIRGIPTIAAFKNGKELTRQAGAMPQDTFFDWLRRL